MINTDGAATVANYPLKKGREPRSIPASPEGRNVGEMIAERDSDRLSPVQPCFLIIGVYMNGADEEGRYAETYQAPDAETAESMAVDGAPGINGVEAEDGLVVAAVLNAENGTVIL